MKKLFLILLLALSFNLVAQKSNVEQYPLTFVNLCVQESEGYIDYRQSNEYSESIVSIIPHYYNFNIFSSSIKRVIDKYDDVIIIQPWERSDNDKNSIILCLDFPNHIMIISFYDDDNTKTIYVWSKK
jgi:hypothetical protein